MTIEEIVHGESKNVEFKVKLPDKAEKYIKTVIAFANTQGGQLIIGVDDVTRKVVGVDRDSVFHVMDSIANAISDSCEPQIVPVLEPYTINGKTIIIVTVDAEPHRPYYLKAKGKEAGAYIRVGATTRLASLDKIKELELEGAKVSWDELTCVGYKVTENAIKKLCRDMNRYRKEMQIDKEGAKKLPTVTRSNLENWKLIKKTNDAYSASNAFVLLTSDYFRYSKTQCAVFAGLERGEFIDKQDYTGPLYEQIEAAYAFVLRNIRRTAKIEGLIRKESHELPPDAIREMIVNAHCHRNFLDESCVQVALYDDRLEVTSPGGLYYGLTLEEALNGRSRQRNRAVAEVFNQMGLIEAWGNGLKNIQKEAEAFDLQKPEFIEMPETFRVNLYRKPIFRQNVRENVGDVAVYVGENVGDMVVNDCEMSVKSGGNVGNVGENVGKSGGDDGEIVSFVRENMAYVGKSDCEMSVNVGKNVGKVAVNDGKIKETIIEIISNDKKISAAQIAKLMSVTRRTVERHIKELREDGRLVRHGSARGGYWEVV